MLFQNIYYKICSCSNIFDLKVVNLYFRIFEIGSQMIYISTKKKKRIEIMLHLSNKKYEVLIGSHHQYEHDMFVLKQF